MVWDCLPAHRHRLSTNLWVLLQVFQHSSRIQNIHHHIRGGLGHVRRSSVFPGIHSRSSHCWRRCCRHPARCAQHHQPDCAPGETTHVYGYRDQCIRCDSLCRTTTRGRLYTESIVEMVLLDVGSMSLASYASADIFMYSNLPIGAVVLLALQYFLRVDDRNSQYRQLTWKNKLNSMDPFGCFVFISAVCCLLLALQWGGQTKPWKSATIIGLFVGFGGLTAAFIVIQLKMGVNALIPIHVFKRRSIWTASMVLFFLGSCQYLVSRAISLFVCEDMLKTFCTDNLLFAVLVPIRPWHHSHR